MFYSMTLLDNQSLRAAIQHFWQFCYLLPHLLHLLFVFLVVFLNAFSSPTSGNKAELSGNSFKYTPPLTVLQQSVKIIIINTQQITCYKVILIYQKCMALAKLGLKF